MNGLLVMLDIAGTEIAELRDENAQLRAHITNLTAQLARRAEPEDEPADQ